MPSAYADSEITGPYSASVTFAGKVPAGATEYFKALPGHVDVELVGGAPFPRAELRAEGGRWNPFAEWTPWPRLWIFQLPFASTH